jgi:butyryl-CoA dehydrogenase
MINDLKKELNKYCTQKILPHLEKDEENSHFRMEIFNGLGELGFTGMTLPEKYGGSELSYADYSELLAEIAKTSVSYAVTISVSSMVQTIINEFGNEKQKETYLPSLATGKGIGAFALSESHAGSDATNLKCTAKKVEGGYILNGNKMWITSGGIAEIYIVMARTGAEGANGVSAFIVKNGNPGLTFGKQEKKIGWKISPTRELIFQNCFVPNEDLVQKEGMGFKLAISGLNRGRIAIGAIATGVAEQAMTTALKYTLERQQFNQNIFEFQGLQFMLADMATEIEAAKLIVQKAASQFDQGINDIKMASMAKLKATEVAMSVTTDAVQLMGGVGITSEFPLERYMRDAKILQIVEGTNQIQKVVIGRELKKEVIK